MKLLKTKSELVEARSVPGILTCTINHEIKATTATASYTGPKLPPELWHQVLAFLRWVNDTTHSEAQARLYLNLTTKEWAAWAYPQEAKTGMSAKELPEHERTAPQRLRFKDSDGWVNYGTVHSHCNCGAFQSGTDEANESNQDGLHITVGELNKEHFDLHCRFYRSLMKFEPDLSEFWEIGEPWASAPFVDRAQAAKWLMGIPPAQDATFPEEWRENIIEIKPAVQEFRGLAMASGAYSTHLMGGPPTPTAKSENNGDFRLSKRERKAILNEPEWKRLEMAAKAIEAGWTVANGPDLTELCELLEQISEPDIAVILEICREYNVSPDRLAGEFRWTPPTQQNQLLGYNGGNPWDGISDY